MKMMSWNEMWKWEQMRDKILVSLQNYYQKFYLTLFMFFNVFIIYFVF